MPRIYKAGGNVNISGILSDIISINIYQFDWDVRNGIYYVRDKIQNQSHKLGIFSDIENESGMTYASDSDVVFDLNQLTKLNGNTSPILITQMARDVDSILLTAQANVGDKIISVSDASNVIVGSYIVIFNTSTNRYYQGKAVSKSVNDVTLDSEIDSVFDVANSSVYIGDTDMTVDGSTTPVVFKFRADELDPVNVSIVVTKIIITMETETLGNLSQFGDIARLTNGILFKKIGSFEYNIFNAKDNREIKNIGYDLEFISAQGSQPDGLAARVVFTEIGSKILVNPGDNIILKVQDDLRDLTKFEITCKGYVLT